MKEQTRTQGTTAIKTRSRKGQGRGTGYRNNVQEGFFDRVRSHLRVLYAQPEGRFLIDHLPPLYRDLLRDMVASSADTDAAWACSVEQRFQGIGFHSVRQKRNLAYLALGTQGVRLEDVRHPSVERKEGQRILSQLQAYLMENLNGNLVYWNDTTDTVGHGVPPPDHTEHGLVPRSSHEEKPMARTMSTERLQTMNYGIADMAVDQRAVFAANPYTKKDRWYVMGLTGKFPKHPRFPLASVANNIRHYEDNGTLRRVELPGLSSYNNVVYEIRLNEDMVHYIRELGYDPENPGGFLPEAVHAVEMDPDDDVDPALAEKTWASLEEMEAEMRKPDPEPVALPPLNLGPEPSTTVEITLPLQKDTVRVAAEIADQSRMERLRHLEGKKADIERALDPSMRDALERLNERGVILMDFKAMDAELSHIQNEIAQMGQETSATQLADHLAPHLPTLSRMLEVIGTSK